MTPVIGLTAYREEAAWGVWHQSADLLHRQYADCVVAAGGVPVLLPAVITTADQADVLIDRLDGLIICGGADVDPARYGEQPHPRTAGWRTDRDASEAALLAAAERAARPVLGVCRGMQLMAVLAGGSLDQHTPDTVGHLGHGPEPGVFGTVEVTTVPGSRVAALVGPDAEVPCHHHQSVHRHPGFEATATAADGTVEAMEAPGDRFCMAIQWHPEQGTDLALFEALVNAAKERERV